MADLAPVQRPHHGAVAQHDDPVGAGLDLAQPMRDEDHGDAGALEIRHDGEQPVGFRQGEARGGLVHDDEPGVERERLDDLEHLALGDRQGRDGRVGREVAAEPLEERGHPRPQRRTIDQPERAGPGRLAADEDVGGRVEVVEEVQLLVHEGDAGAERLGDGEGLVVGAADRDPAGARRHDAAEDLHQGRLAGPVLADEAQHLAGLDGEADVLQRPHARIGLVDVAQLEQRLGHGAPPSGIGTRRAGRRAPPRRRPSRARRRALLAGALLQLGREGVDVALLDDLGRDDHEAVRRQA